MDAAQPQIKSYPVEVLTSTVQISGNVSMLGDFLLFLNDELRNTFAIADAEITPLQTSWRVGGASRDEILVPKPHVHIVLAGDVNADEFQLFPRSEAMIVYTDTFVVNANIHLGAETLISETFHAQQGPFFPATDAEVYSVMPLNVDIRGAAPIVFINREHVGAYYQK